MLTYKWIAHRRLVYWTRFFGCLTAFFIFIQQKTSTSEDGEMYEVMVPFQWVSKHQLNEDKIRAQLRQGEIDFYICKCVSTLLSGRYANARSKVHSFCDALVLSVLYRNFEYYLLSFKI